MAIQLNSRPRVDYNRFAGRCVAVTSLSTNPHRAQRQAFCLRSWKRAGLQILAVNSPEEHQALRRLVKDLCTQIVVEPPDGGIFSRRTPRVGDMLRVAAETEKHILLLNSDLELYGDPAPLVSAIGLKDTLTIAVRWNHRRCYPRRTAKPEEHGLDGFMMTSEMAATFPTSPLAVGQPAWDFWLPHHSLALGHKIHWIAESLLYHENHERHWLPSEIEPALQWIRRQYGLPEDHNWGAFRSQTD